MTSHTGTTYIDTTGINSPKEDRPIPVPSVMSPTGPKRHMVITVAVIFIAYVFLLMHGPTTTDTLTPMTVEEETTSLLPSPRSCFQKNVEYTST